MKFTQQKNVSKICYGFQAEYYVDKVIGSRIRNGQGQYLVQWYNSPIEDATWEPHQHLEHAQEAVKEFDEQFPHKPGPFCKQYLKRGV